MILMNNTVSLILNPEQIELPEAPAVYAIFSSTQCRFVGVSRNLHTAIINHCSPLEPNVTLRYFMQSNKCKILLYEILKHETSSKCDSIRQTWIELFEPTNNSESLKLPSDSDNFKKVIV